MQVSGSSAAASTTPSSAPAASSSTVKTGQSAGSQAQADATVTDSFEQVYQRQDAAASQAGTTQPENKELDAIVDELAGQTEPLSQPQLEQLAQWLQTQPDPAQALGQLMQMLGLQQGQNGELPQQLTAMLTQLQGGSDLPFGGRSGVTGGMPISARTGMSAPATAANVMHGMVESKPTEPSHELKPIVLNSQNMNTQASQSAALTESLQQLFSTQGMTQQNLQGLHVLTQQMMSTAAMQQAATSATSNTSTLHDVATQHLQASVDISSPEWGKELVDQLRSRMSFTKQEALQKAYIRLDPPELGKLEVSIRVDGDKASVHFAAAHPQLREALAANADRLRMDFDGSALDLVDVSVSSGMQQQSQSQEQAQQDEIHIAANEVASSGMTIPAYALSSRFESMV
ncbi:flagellar hook-length control protein FliK [Photobacterium nomapromontoriensis]|uniref:flagellar hook-length control protein FliK n=1 Tax=Photobacterium nomapromontoriensis TaxID=2910237 RepID=UPI003D0C5552